MRKTIGVFALALLLGIGQTWADTSTGGSEPNSKNAVKKATPKKQKQKQATKPKPPKRPYPALTAPPSERSNLPPLTGKQVSMRDAFLECIAYSTEHDPVGAVKEYVFSLQTARENGGLRSFLESIRGSPTHHGHEVCLARAYGMRGFKDTPDIRTAQGAQLVPLESTASVEVVEGEIPPDRRFTRPWVREYVNALGETMRKKAVEEKREGSFIPLRVASTIRAIDDQQKLVQRGLTPADCRFDYLCSTHTTGSSVDIGLRGAGKEEIAQLQAQLLADQRARKIFFIRENSHFHVFVLPPEYVGEE